MTGGVTTTFGALAVVDLGASTGFVLKTIPASVLRPEPRVLGTFFLLFFGVDHVNVHVTFPRHHVLNFWNREVIHEFHHEMIFVVQLQRIALH
jgi:hypothetical protein